MWINKTAILLLKKDLVLAKNLIIKDKNILLLQSDLIGFTFKSTEAALA